MLFVCVENANRSQMAAAFARLHGGNAVEAYSAGSRPAAAINPKAIEAMREVGYNLSLHSPISINDIPAGDFDFVATMGCGDACPNVSARIRQDWNIADPRHMAPDEFRAVRDEIERHVIQALHAIGATPRVNFNRAAANAETSMKKRLLTFRGGGWVLAMAAVVSIGMLAWAATMMLTLQRPMGDGKTLESYGFALNNLQVPRHLVVPAAPHRDPAPVLAQPTHTSMEDMQAANDPKYGKYLVPSDVVIGVAINGDARAYPLHVMYVHEIINDTLGGVPIAVTHNWLCDSTVVFDRRVMSGSHADARERVAEFSVSGLVYNSNLLMYDRTEPLPRTERTTAPASLWCQLTADPISGGAVSRQERLMTIPYELTRFDAWTRLHPETTVLNRDLRLTQRYKKAMPLGYFQSPELLFPVQPLPPDRGPAAKSHIVAVQAGSDRGVFEVDALRRQAIALAADSPDIEASLTHSLGSTSVRFEFDHAFHSLRVLPADDQIALRVTHSFWFAWHAMFPDDPLLP